jgi:hypothetical protein
MDVMFLCFVFKFSAINLIDSEQLQFSDTGIGSREGGYKTSYNKLT